MIVGSDPYSDILNVFGSAILTSEENPHTIFFFASLSTLQQIQVWFKNNFPQKINVHVRKPATIKGRLAHQ